jgi:hypothetical protein
VELFSAVLSMWLKNARNKMSGYFRSFYLIVSVM